MLRMFHIATSPTTVYVQPVLPQSPLDPVKCVSYKADGYQYYSCKIMLCAELISDSENHIQKKTTDYAAE